MIFVDRAYELGCYFVVEGHTILQPFGESHKDLDYVDDGGFFVESFDGGRQFSEFIAEAVYGVGVGAFVNLFDESVDGEQEFVDEFGSCNGCGGSFFLPSVVFDPSAYGDCGDACFVGDVFLLFALHIEQSGELFFLLELFFSEFHSKIAL